MDVLCVGALRRAVLTTPYDGQVMKLVILDEAIPPDMIQRIYRLGYERVFGE
jgi:hypothetical protein